jgi:CRP/FNR family transcriptional activator FtrB
MRDVAIRLARGNALLSAIPGADLPQLLDGGPAVTLAPGEKLVAMGEAARHLWLILDGDIYLGAPGATGIALGPGDTVGEEAAILDQPHAYDAQALSDSVLAAVDAGALRAYLESHFQVAIAMISSLSSLLRQRVKEITELKMQSTTERLAGFLLDLAGDAKGPIVVNLPFEKRHLAVHLGMDPATLSRAFAKLRDQGVEAGRSDKVTISDVGLLRRMGDFAETGA